MMTTDLFTNKSTWINVTIRFQHLVMIRGFISIEICWLDNTDCSKRGRAVKQTDRWIRFIAISQCYAILLRHQKDVKCMASVVRVGLSRLWRRDDDGAKPLHFPAWSCSSQQFQLGDDSQFISVVTRACLPIGQMVSWNGWFTSLPDDYLLLSCRYIPLLQTTSISTFCLVKLVDRLERFNFKPTHGWTCESTAFCLKQLTIKWSLIAIYCWSFHVINAIFCCCFLADSNGFRFSIWSAYDERLFVSSNKKWRFMEVTLIWPWNAGHIRNDSDRKKWAKCRDVIANRLVTCLPHN